jgi:hypothetical protein
MDVASGLSAQVVPSAAVSITHTPLLQTGQTGQLASHTPAKQHSLPGQVLTHDPSERHCPRGLWLLAEQAVQAPLTQSGIGLPHG